MKDETKWLVSNSAKNKNMGECNELHTDPTIMSKVTRLKFSELKELSI